MFKRLSCILLIIIFSFSVSLSVFAEDPAGIRSDKLTDGTPVLNIVKNNDTNQTEEQFLLNITRPDVSTETTFKKSYVICGIAGKSDVKVSLSKKNEETGQYEEFLNTDGDSSWKVGSKGLFTKEIALSKGDNKIRLVVYKESDVGKLKLENIQVSCFTIKFYDESVKDKIVNGILNFTQKVTEIFSGSGK